MNQVVVACQQVKRIIAINGYTGSVPRKFTFLITETLVKQFTIHISITMIIRCSLPVGNRRTHYGDFERVDTFFTTVDIVNISAQVQCNVISTVVQVNILGIISLRTHADFICRTFHTFHHVIPAPVHHKVKAFAVTHTGYSGQLHSSAPDTFSLISQRHPFVYRPSVRSDASHKCPAFYRGDFVRFTAQVNGKTNLSGHRGGNAIIICSHHSFFIPFSDVYSLAVFCDSLEQEVTGTERGVRFKNICRTPVGRYHMHRYLTFLHSTAAHSE